MKLEEKQTSGTDVQPNVPVPAKQKKTPRINWKLLLVLGVVVVLAIWFFTSRSHDRSSETDALTSAYTKEAVTHRDITASITGSGTLEAADSYSVTSLLESDILSADFEEGDSVEKDSVLYVLDSSDVNDSLEQAQISLNQATRSYDKAVKKQEDLTITAPCAGQIISMDLEAGDEVNQGQVLMTIRNSSTMTLELPFLSVDAAHIFVGDAAQVTLDSSFETISGTVTRVAAYDTVLSGNRIVRTVTLDVPNPGALTTAQTATACIGEAYSCESGTFAYKDEETVTCTLSGEIASLPVEEGSWVSKDQTLMRLESEDLEDSIQNAKDAVDNAQRTLDNQYERLEDYIITSPIQGTIVDKNYKAGETANAGKVLCTIFDLSYLTMTLNVDELDISELKVGQSVILTADAVEGRTYEGVVTKVSVAGTAANGAATYPVTIRVDETEGLLPGMTVDATILLHTASDALSIPSGALMRGNKVLLTADSPSAAGKTPNELGFVPVDVTVGVGDNDYLEITSGLQDGDTVAYIPVTGSGDLMQMMINMGMPAGGGPGGS